MILLDTCTLLWLVMDQQHLTSKARETIFKNQENLFVSAGSVFEIGIKVQKGKLSLPQKTSLWFAKSLELHGLQGMDISAEIAAFSTELPLIHLDPFDRILIATAQVHDLTILTPDTHIRQYPNVKTVW